ncbi:Gypsy retrotransposon integrase-like protein 1 [Lecanora helva]
MSETQNHDESSDGEEDSQSPDQNASGRSNQPAQSLAPLQKRRRVTRACDECRRKKIKCDGKQPCTHCTVYSYDCTYDQPSNRRRNPAPQYVEALEIRTRRAENLLKTVLPDVNLDDSGLDTDASQYLNVAMKNGKQGLPTSQMRPWEALAKVPKPQQSVDGESDAMLESMVANTGSLDLDEEGNWDFYGHSSGRIFLRKMRDQFGDLMGNPGAMPLMRHNSEAPRPSPVDSPKTLVDTPIDPNLPKTHDLPDKQSAKLLCENALDDAGAILRVVHQPTFYVMFNRIYDTPYENYGDAEHRFLPLLYGVIALGALFAKADQSPLQLNGYENAIDQGYRWHKLSRQMMDVTECRDLTSVQVVLYMILFLQSSARLSTCYAYLGVALRSAIRLGLHRSVPNAFNPVEREVRKRVFWIIRKLDIYVGALLGLPQMLSNDDIDQEMPIEVDDEYITMETVSPMPSGKLSFFTAINAHTQLVEILAKTAKYIYPIKESGTWGGKGSQSYVVSHAKVREIEQDLQKWMENLPVPFRPGEETSPEFMRIRHLLRMAYAHIQMFLYRPFLHYISQSVQKRSTDKRSYACAAACVSVSRNIIHLTGQMKRRGLLVGSYWFYMYTTFFAIIALVFYVLENPQSPKVEDVLQDAHEGKDTLRALAAKSLAADRCSTILAELFEQLPSRPKDLQKMSSQKKRPAASQVPTTASKNMPNGPTKSTNAGGVDNKVSEAGLILPTQRDLQDPFTSQDRSTLNLQTLSNMDSAFAKNLQGPHTPSTANGAFMQASNSPHNSIPPNGDQPTYDMQNTLAGQGVPDVSAVMFPSADPFAYPNQPMTTLENHQLIKQESPVDPSIFNTSDAAAVTSAPYDNYGAQMYNQLPPYVLPEAQPSYLQGLNEPMSMTSTDPTTASIGTQSYEPGHWPLNRQERLANTSGVGFDQLFGEDWGGWMSQYRH